MPKIIKKNLGNFLGFSEENLPKIRGYILKWQRTIQKWKLVQKNSMKL